MCVKFYTKVLLLGLVFLSLSPKLNSNENYHIGKGTFFSNMAIEVKKSILKTAEKNLGQEFHSYKSSFEKALKIQGNPPTLLGLMASYTSVDVPVTIPVSSGSNITVTSTLTIADAGLITDLNVSNIDITHTYVDDLNISITSPAGTTVNLMVGPCGAQQNILISMDDEGAAYNTWPCPPTDGNSYQPQGSLSAFDGESITGTWTLTIQDVYRFDDGGTLNGWGLDITTNIVSQVLTSRISSSSDDSEEDLISGVIDLFSTDLELTQETNNQIVGLRFQGINVAPGASILSANIEFEVDEITSGATNLTFYGEDIDSSFAFTATPYDISTKTKTTASVAWTGVPAWSVESSKQTTPDLTTIIQEVVNRPGWTSGNPITFLVEGSGVRIAEAYDGEPTNAPLLTITYAGCGFTNAGVTTTCSDNGTPYDGSDDTFTVTFNPMGTSLGATYSISGSITDTGVSYGVTSPTYGPFSISAGNLTFSLSDDDNAGCEFTNQKIAAPSPCVATTICNNGSDDDNDGLFDENDPDCDCGDGQTFQTILGNAVGVESESGVTNGNNALGDADGNYAELYDSNDEITLELGNEIPMGNSYSLVWRRKSSYSNNQTAEITVEESPDNINWTTNPFIPGTSDKVNFVITSITANVNTRFIRLSQDNGGNDDFDLDAIEYELRGCFPYELCSNGLDDDNDGLTDADDPDCTCTVCFTPIVQEFLLPFPEDEVFDALKSMYPSNAFCGINVTEVSAPITSYISISAFVDSTIIYFDHWEDGYETELTNPSQSTSMVWGDGNPSNGFPIGYPDDIINAGSVLILNNDIDPTTLQTVTDFDGGDRFGSSLPLAVTRAAWADGTETLFAGALEVYPTSSWGTNYTIPFGENTDVSYQYFEHVGITVMAAEDNTTLNINVDATGGYDVSTTLNKGESYHVDGGIMAGAAVVADKVVQVDVITGDICDSYESRWFTLPPEDQWSDNYYSPMGGATISYQLYNPNPTAITVRRRINTGATTDLVVAAGSTARFNLTTATGVHMYSLDGSDFYATVMYDATDTDSEENSRSDWGSALIPYDRLTPQVVVGWAPGHDPAVNSNENGSPLWVTAAYPPGATNGGSIQICIDYDGDNSGPNTDAFGRNYDTSVTLNELDRQQIFDPDGDQSNMALYVCNNVEAVLSVIWGQDAAHASPATPGLDLGTGVPGLNPFFAYKTVSLIADQDQDERYSVGDTIEYSIGISNLGLVQTSGNYLVTDDFPADLTYIASSTTLNDGTTVMSIPDATNPTTSFPLDEGGVSVALTLDPSAEAVISFRARIDAVPSGGLITNTATVSKDGISYDPDVTIEVFPPSEVCDNFIDDDFDGIIDCDCITEDNLIGGFIFIDENQDGNFDEGEAVQSNIDINLYQDNDQDGVLDPTDTYIGTQTSLPQGSYGFGVAGNVISRRIAASNDDANEDISLFFSGSVETNNADLDLGYGYEGVLDRSLTGLRFTNISIPAGATITDAYIEFKANSNESGGCTIYFWLEDVLDATPFVATNLDISNRPKSPTSITWSSVPNWSNNQLYQSPNLAGLIQDKIDEVGWVSGNDINFLIEGTDRREAYSYEDDPTTAPLLVINYAFFPSYYIAEIDTNSVNTLSAGATLSTPTTMAFSFNNEDDFSCANNFGMYFMEICGNGVDDDFDGLIDCQDPDTWQACCIPDSWDFDCDDGTCVEIVGTGAKDSLPVTLTFTDTSSIQYIIIEATYNNGGGLPDTVTFAGSNGFSYDVEKTQFTVGDDWYFRAYFESTSSITLTEQGGGIGDEAESFIAYIFRDCENTSSSGEFTHKSYYQTSHTFNLSIPTSVVPRDVEIVVPLSEITPDGRIAIIEATAGSVFKSITIDMFNYGNSLNITPFILEDVPGNVTNIAVEVISPPGGQSLYLSGAGAANSVCPILYLNKSADMECATVGETITYTYEVVNAGSVNINSVDLVDDKLGAISLGTNNLSPGESVTVTETYTVQASDLPGPITNIATLTGTPAGGSQLTEVDSVTVDLLDISIDKTANVTDANLGETVTYTYHITNNGNLPLTLDLVDDKLGALPTSEIPDEASLVSFYNFNAGTGTTIYDISEVPTTSDLVLENSFYAWGASNSLTINNPNRAADTTSNNKLFAALTATNEITVETWVTPANTTQSGPARIVSYSRDGSNRNFSLMQEGGSYNVRLRTTTNGNNGNSVELLGGTVTTSLTHLAFTRNVAGTAVLYVNGVAVDTETILGDFSNWDATHDFLFFNEGGNDAITSRDWQGEMRMSAVYSRAFSASEISARYSAGHIVEGGVLGAGDTFTLNVDHVLDGDDMPSPLINTATVTGTPFSCSKTTQAVDNAQINLCLPNIDFSIDSYGNAFVTGDTLFEDFANWGIHVTTLNPSNYPPMIFNSTAPSGGDPDLGTPNSDFGGPGTGDGGKAGRIGENNTALGNSLIISEDYDMGDPDDNGDGGTIRFTFDNPTELAYVQIVDVDYGEVDGRIRLYDSGNNLIVERRIIAYGDNSFQNVVLNGTNVSRMDIYFPGSGSVPGIFFCETPPLTASIGDFVWHDQDGDGIQDGGEPGLENVVVRLEDSNGNLLATDTTDVSGLYSFLDVVPGTYDVEIQTSTLPLSFGNTYDLDGDLDDDSGPFTINGGEVRNDIDFGYNLDCNFPIANDDVFTGCPELSYTASVAGNDNNLVNHTYELMTNGTIGNVVMNSDGSFTYTPNTFGCGTDSITYRVWNIVSECPDTAKAYFNMVDTVDPVLSQTPADVTIECSATVPSPPSITATDNCMANVTVNYSQSDDQGTGCNEFNYTITRTWSATDECGNTVTHIQTITVEDSTDPTINESLPADVTVECDNVPSAATLTASDNCDNSVVVTFNETDDQTSNGSCSDNDYTITRTWTATDVCGNSFIHVQTINVQDTGNPTLSGVPADLTVECDNVPGAANPTASDACDTNVSITFNETSTQTNTGACTDFDYTITREWTATDNCGNSVTQTQIVAVEDNSAPTLSGVPADVTVECDNVPAAANPTASDTCDPNISITLNETSTQTSNDSCTDYAYTITREWTATDNCGNAVTQTQIVTVEDNGAPTLSGVPGDVTVECDAIPSPPTVTGSDICDPSITVSYNETNTPGVCPDDYTLTREWTATDACGNSLTLTQTITVEDNTPPVLSGIPSDITITSLPVPDPPVIGTDITASDNCGDVNITLNETGGDGCNYVIVRTWTASDDCGNQTSQSQTITVDLSSVDPGTLTISDPNVCLPPAGTGIVSATSDGNSSVPGGYSVIYFLVSIPDYVIQQTSSTPSFTLSNAGDYSIQTLVYVADSGDPNYLDLSFINLGTTSIFEVVALLQQGGGSLCGELDMTVADIKVESCDGIIGDFVWNDIDKNGMQDIGEPGIEGVKVYLIDAYQNIIDSTLTNSSGGYQFTDLISGTYSLSFDVSTNTAGVDNYLPTIEGIGTEAQDSDIDHQNLKTDPIYFDFDQGNNLDIDAGFYKDCLVGDCAGGSISN